MKSILLISIGLIALSGRTFSQQCPAGGLKIQSPDCKDPGNLTVNIVSCSTLAVKWHGSKTQAYIVKAAFTDPATNNIVEGEVTNISCDDNGNCGTTLPAKERTSVSWSVQAVCSVEGVIIYSAKVNGPDAYIPFCEKVINVNRVNAIRIYPNPSSNYLNVEFDGKITRTIAFRIFDVAGKQVYNKSRNAVPGKINSRYKLDLRGLPAGTYLLEVYNGKDTNQVKFVLLKK